MSSVSSCTTPSTNTSSSSTPPPSSSNSHPLSFSLQSPPQIPDENPPSHIMSVNQLNYFVPQNVIGNARVVPVYQATFNPFGFPQLMVVAMKQIFQELASYGASVTDINKTRIVNSCNMSEFNGVQNCKVGFGATVYEYGQSPETPPGFLPIGDVCLWASPPEVYKSNTDMSLHTSASDIWQLGITAFELAWGSNLRVTNRADLEIQIGYAIEGLEDGPNGVFLNANFQKFLSDCLKEEPSERPTSQQLLNHEFFRRY